MSSYIEACLRFRRRRNHKVGAYVCIFVFVAGQTCTSSVSLVSSVRRKRWSFHLWTSKIDKKRATVLKITTQFIALLKTQTLCTWKTLHLLILSPWERPVLSIKTGVEKLYSLSTKTFESCTRGFSHSFNYKVHYGTTVVHNSRSYEKSDTHKIKKWRIPSNRRSFRPCMANPSEGPIWYRTGAHFGHYQDLMFGSS